MSKILMILAGIFLFGIFGDIFNDLLYYVGFAFRFVFDFLQYVLSNFIGLSDVGLLIISLIYYAFLFIIFKKIISLFTNI